MVAFAARLLKFKKNLYNAQYQQINYFCALSRFHCKTTQVQTEVVPINQTCFLQEEVV